MRNANLLVAAMIGMMAGQGMEIHAPRSEPVKPTRREEKNAERLAKAEAKRQRKAAKRLKEKA